MKDVLKNQIGPVKVGRISYVNVDPVYYGLEQIWKPEEMQIVSAPPSQLNHKLAGGELDISAVSSFAYTQHPSEWLLLSDFCIACLKDVMSVLLVSRYPLKNLSGKRIYVTNESATAAALIRLVLKMRSVSPIYERGEIYSPQDIRKNDGAALVIGDTAMKGDWHKTFPHVWDLGDLWSQLTGLPFVFAVWAVRRSFAEKYPETVSGVQALFKESRKIGLANIEKVALSASRVLGIQQDICKRYFANFCYDLGTPQINGLTMFFKRLYEKKMVNTPVNLSFF